MKLLEGKVALITGASRGIGKGIALKFASEGADIAFTDLFDDENMAATVKEIEALGVKAKGYASNAADFAQTEEVVNKVKEDFGHIDVLVNNAGITRDGLLVRMTEEQFDLVTSVNYKSVFNMTRQAGAIMFRQRSGRIINISSVAGLYGNAGQFNYSAAKAGIIGMTKTTAKELGSRGITCNAVAPGFVKTPMTDVLKEEYKAEIVKSIALGRLGDPEDIANAVAFLASDRAGYITGQVLEVSGGMSM